MTDDSWTSYTIQINPRVVVHGAAGTGKTILAQELARRLAAGGKSVLLLFYNRGIAKQVGSAFERHFVGSGERFRVLRSD